MGLSPLLTGESENHQGPLFVPGLTSFEVMMRMNNKKIYQRRTPLRRVLKTDDAVPLDMLMRVMLMVMMMKMMMILMLMMILMMMMMMILSHWSS